MPKSNINIYPLLIFVLFLVSCLFFNLEYFNISIISSLIVCLFIYKFCKIKFHLQQFWLSHPLRIMIPITLVIQSLLWIIFLLYSYSTTFQNYDWVFDYHSDPTNIPHAYSGFLLLISAYFYAIAITFKPTRLRSFEEIKLSSNKTLYAIILLLIVISLLDYIFIYASLTSVDIFSLFSYILKFLAKLRPIFTLVLIYYLWYKNTLTSKISLIFFITSYLLLGFVGLYLTSMRQLVFEIIIIIIIFFYTVRKQIRLNISRFILLSVIIFLGMFIFTLASSIKTEEPSQNIMNRGSKTQIFLFNLQQFVSRGTLYAADNIALSNPDANSIFKTKQNNIFAEIVSGIPFGGILIPESFKSRYSFDMQFFWSYLSSGISSTYVSGTTCLWFIFEMPLAIVIMFLVGVFHGKSFQVIANWLGVKYTWLVIYSMVSFFFFYGLARSDLLGLPIYSLLGALILKYFFIKKSSSISSVSNTLSGRL